MNIGKSIRKFRRKNTRAISPVIATLTNDSHRSRRFIGYIRLVLWDIWVSQLTRSAKQYKYFQP